MVLPQPVQASAARRSIGGRIMSRAADVKKIVREATRQGWVHRNGGRHEYLERDGVRIPFSRRPGSDAAIRALRVRIRKGRNI